MAFFKNFLILSGLIGVLFLAQLFCADDRAPQDQQVLQANPVENSDTSLSSDDSACGSLQWTEDSDESISSEDGQSAVKKEIIAGIEKMIGVSNNYALCTYVDSDKKTELSIAGGVLEGNLYKNEVVKSALAFAEKENSLIDAVGTVNAEQLAFLQRASDAWSRGRMYGVMSSGDYKIIRSLPEALRAEGLYRYALSTDVLKELGLTLNEVLLQSGKIGKVRSRDSSLLNKDEQD